MAKSLLEANNIPYHEVNVAGDKAARDEMVAKSGQMSVPAIEIDGEFVIGYDQELLKEKLAI